MSELIIVSSESTEKETSNFLKILGIIGGAWLTSELLKTIAKRTTVYSCPKCNADIEYNVKQCHLCNSMLKWPEHEQNGETTFSQ